MSNSVSRHTCSTAESGVYVRAVYADSPAYAGGVRPGDRILSINGSSVVDDLDVSFFSAEERLKIVLIRRGKRIRRTILRNEGVWLGLETSAPAMRRCANRCVFCFIDQLPRGLRKSLYIKDEDYRHSFLNGSYVTLTSLKKSDFKRIAELGLSPLYISVHAVDPRIRIRLLRNRRAGAILEQLAFLEQNGIGFHAQVVVCPGINDGAALEQTIRTLLDFRDGLLSLAIVPVGLTRFHTQGVIPVTAEGAREICGHVMPLSDADKAANGVRRLFLADELFIRAGTSIPGRAYYEEYPQIENGVGLVRQLLEQRRRVGRTILRGQAAGRRKRCLILTSKSAAPYLSAALTPVKKRFQNFHIAVEPVQNAFFGEQVTVAGLLTARDVLDAIRMHAGCDIIIIPGAMFNYRGHTLDGWSIDRIARVAGKPVHIADSLEQIVAHLSS